MLSPCWVTGLKFFCGQGASLKKFVTAHKIQRSVVRKLLYCSDFACEDIYCVYEQETLLIAEDEWSANFRKDNAKNCCFGVPWNLENQAPAWAGTPTSLF